MVIPTVHLNGTSRAELLEVRQNAYSKLGEALKALDDMSPNKRDYYLNGNFEQARAQQLKRYTLLKELQAEILAEYEALDT